MFVQVLLQILNSTPETLDAQIEHYAEDIDEDMLYTLQRRIDAAHKMKQVRSQTMSCCILKINVYFHLYSATTDPVELCQGSSCILSQQHAFGCWTRSA